MYSTEDIHLKKNRRDLFRFLLFFDTWMVNWARFTTGQNRVTLGAIKKEAGP
jgi:hypothetical protein